MTEQLAQDALLAAYQMRQPEQPLYLHSDQGSQYTSQGFRTLLTQLHIEMFYNPTRRHIANQRLSPADYERRYFMTLKMCLVNAGRTKPDTLIGYVLIHRQVRSNSTKDVLFKLGALGKDFRGANFGKCLNAGVYGFSMKIRRATVADYDRLVAIDTLASASAPECRDRIRTWIETGCCYLAETGKLVGAYGVLNYHFFGNGFIEMIMVGADFRRQGLGIALVQHFKEICETPKIFTSTNLSNQQMQTLLNSAGFRTCGFIDNLDENDPEIVYCFHNP